MSFKNYKIRGVYKYIAKLLESYNLEDSLYMCWTFSKSFKFGHPITKKEAVVPANYNTSSTQEKRLKDLSEFELEFLIREFILHCSLSKAKTETLRNLRDRNKLRYQLRNRLDKEISKAYISPENVLIELYRISHRQFKWQNGYDINTILRYYLIYSHPDLEANLYKKFKMGPKEIFIIGFYIFQTSSSKFKTEIPLRSETDVLTNKMLSTFIDHFSMSIDEAKTLIQESHKIDETIFYQFNPLLGKPIIRLDDSIICPLHLLLVFRITSGLYYDIVGLPKVDSALGESFEEYSGLVLKKTLDSKEFETIQEFKYGKQEKRSSDWIIQDSNSILFIECKSKRPTIDSKSQLNMETGISKDLKKMAKFITQLYANYLDYSENKYHKVKFNKSKKFIPLVLTMENWFISFNFRIMDSLREKVIEEFNKKDISLNLLESNPYYISSISDFEYDLQIINNIGIEAFFKKIDDNSINEFKKNFEYQKLFDEEFEDTFIKPFKNQPT